MPTNGKHPLPRRPLFPLGQIVATPGAISALVKYAAEGLATGMDLLMRHVTGDWGDMPAEDKLANEEALKSGARIFSGYFIAPDVKIWIITEADRSSTTLLLPEEY